MQLNVTPLYAFPRATLRVADSDGFPSNRIACLVQAAPAPIPWPANPALAVETPYWLLPPERVPPLGETAFALSGVRTTTLWIRLDTRDVAPGLYTIRLRLAPEGRAPLDLPLTVRVHPVRLPARRAIALGPAGTVYGDVMQPEPARRFFENSGTMVRSGRSSTRCGSTDVASSRVRYAGDGLFYGQSRAVRGGRLPDGRLLAPGPLVPAGARAWPTKGAPAISAPT